MKTFMKLCICVLMMSGFTACFPVGIAHQGGRENRWNYNNHRYNNGREYRHARRQGSVEIRIQSEGNHNR